MKVWMTERLIVRIMVSFLQFDTGKYGAHHDAMRTRYLNAGFSVGLRDQS